MGGIGFMGCGSWCLEYRVTGFVFIAALGCGRGFLGLGCFDLLGFIFRLRPLRLAPKVHVEML